MIYIHMPYPSDSANRIHTLLADQKKSLLVQGVLYPSVCLIGGKHDNLVYELKADSQFSANRGSISDLVKSIVKYQSKNPEGRILLSTSRLALQPFELLYKFIGILSRYDRVCLLLGLNTQVNYLASLYQNQTNPLSAYEWVDDIVRSNKYGVNYSRTVLKLERLVNSRNLKAVLDSSNVISYTQDISNILKVRISSADHIVDTALTPRFPEELVQRIIEMLSDKYMAGNNYIASRYLPTISGQEIVGT